MYLHSETYLSSLKLVPEQAFIAITEHIADNLDDCKVFDNFDLHNYLGLHDSYNLSAYGWIFVNLDSSRIIILFGLYLDHTKHKNLMIALQLLQLLGRMDLFTRWDPIE